MPLKLPFQKSPPAKSRGKSAPKKDEKKPAATRAPARSAGEAPHGKTAPKAPAGKTVHKPAPQPAPPLPPLFNLSTDRKLDILGIFLALVGLVIGLTLLSSNQGALTGGLLEFFKFLFGNGVYALWLALILFGGWLVLRKIDRIPPVSVERVTGLLLIFLLIQTALDAFSGDGGWFGNVIYRLLDTFFGFGGALIVMLAWLLIALTLAFDVTVPELLGKLKPLFDALAKLWAMIFSRLEQNRRGTDSPHPAPVENGFTPLNRDSAPPAAGEATPLQQPVGVPVTTVGRQVEWVLPMVREVLQPGNAASVNEEFVEQRARLIEETLASFGAPAQVVEINRGPTITQFGVEPLFVESRHGRTRVRVSKIVSLSDDLALALAAPRIRIQAPVPGRSYLGIEVPNDEMTLVTLREILEAEAFLRSRKQLSFALGRDVSGHPIGAELTMMPHLLIAGTTGSGKSVCVNAILTCMLLYNTPDDLRIVLVDPKRVELTNYNGVPHLLAPVVVEMERVLGALQWMTREMDRRYHAFAQAGARNITDYNARMKTQGQKKLPYLVVVIDELADLMMIAPDETERTITRLAQLARATGIHMVLATQRPSVDVVTGLIKANFPARIAFAVASNTDSRVILDQPGAERLLGRGDMLYQSPDAPAPVRLQGVFVSDGEIHRLTDFWRAQNTQGMPIPSGGPVDSAAMNAPLKQVPLFDEDITAAEHADPLYTEAIDLVRREGRASVSMLQRKLRIGYTRAARLVDGMEEKGIIGPPEDATGVRKVLDYGPAAPPAE
jgi:S-DNA-T family DNA segregation ATPase FtsK/SpoIIIE